MTLLDYTPSLADDHAGTLVAHGRPEEQLLVTFSETPTRLQKQLASLLKTIKRPGIDALMRQVFADLSRLLEILRIVEMNARQDGSLTVTVAILALVHNETRTLVDFIETQVADSKSIKGKLHEELVCTSFAIRHELKRVFEYEFAGLNGRQESKHVRADVMRVHGLLSNCFQQSILALARVFEPSLTGSSLFDDYKTRLEQSVVLQKELSTLIRLAQLAEEGRDPAASGLLAEHLRAFCHGTMHNLMYKDWDGFERFAADVISKQGSAGYHSVLHCFARYLETLTSYVKMRTVLSEPAHASPKPKAAKRASRKTSPR